MLFLSVQGATLGTWTQTTANSLAPSKRSIQYFRGVLSSAATTRRSEPSVLAPRKSKLPECKRMGTTTPDKASLVSTPCAVVLSVTLVRCLKSAFHQALAEAENRPAHSATSMMDLLTTFMAFTGLKSKRGLWPRHVSAMPFACTPSGSSKPISTDMKTSQCHWLNNTCSF